jgi:hypothetical protein
LGDLFFPRQIFVDLKDEPNPYGDGDFFHRDYGLDGH